jgi:hypothetical protein
MEASQSDAKVLKQKLELGGKTVKQLKVGLFLSFRPFLSF